MGLNLKDLAEHLDDAQKADIARQLISEADAAPPKRRSKFGAVKTTVDGITFDSKKEAAYYERLVLLQSAGEVKWFCRQPRFTLPGGIEYRADFIVVDVDGVHVVDVKGCKNRLYITKKKMIEAIYTIKIVEIEEI